MRTRVKLTQHIFDNVLVATIIYLLDWFGDTYNGIHKWMVLVLTFG